MRKHIEHKILVILTCTLLIVTSVVTSVNAHEQTADKISDQIQPESTRGDKTPATSLTYTRTFREPTLVTKQVKGSPYTEIVMPHTLSTGETPGAPTYPLSSVALLIPFGKTVSDITVCVETEEIITSQSGIDLKNAPLFPFQPSMPLDEQSSSSQFTINTETYKSENKYPGTDYDSSDVEFCRGFGILSVNLHPTEYFPKQGRLFYHPSMTIEVTLKDSNQMNRFYRANHDDRAWVETLVVNPDILQSYPLVQGTFYSGGLCDPSDNNGCGYEYVIIVRQALASFTGTPYNWTDLIQRKQADGLDATLVTVEDILDCSDYWNTDSLFNDTPARIREFCRDAYGDWGTEYVLIGGDQDGVNAVERRLMDSTIEWGMESDLYWSNLDSTFNDNHDEFWGEPGDSGFDLYSELYIGSIPCDEPIDISNWLTKSFFYEDNNDPEYLSNAAFYGGSTGSYLCQSDDMLDFIIKGTDDWLGPDPHHNNGSYPEWLGFLYGFESWNAKYHGLEYNLSVKWTAEDPNPGWHGGPEPPATDGLKEAINNNQVTLINGLAHANSHKSLDVYDSQWETDYHNTMPFFIYDIGCHSGDMDATDEGVLHSMLFHSATELAFGCMYNTGFGIGNWWNTNASSTVIQKFFWDYMFNQEKSGGIHHWQLGKAQAWSKDAAAFMINNWGNWGYEWRHTVECCLLYGDPALTMKPPIRSDHNLCLDSLDISEHHLQNPEPIVVTVTVGNIGRLEETNVTVRLLVNNTIIGSLLIPECGSCTVQTINFTWVPSGLGIFSITVNVTVTDVVEDCYDDNEKTDTMVIGVLNGDTGECFATIQQAITDPETLDDHYIYVPSGVYDGPIVVIKNISLIGAGRDTTILEGIAFSGTVVDIKNTDGVNLRGFTIQHGDIGIRLESVSNTVVKDTVITNNVKGVDITGFSYTNTILENELCDNIVGIFIDAETSGNLLYHNNFNNTQNVVDNGTDTQWDHGYLEGYRIAGGNWWSDYTGVDMQSGPSQQDPEPDGIGDTPYTISGGTSQDRYPLMEPYHGLLRGKIFVDESNTMGPWDGTQEHPYQHIQDAINVSIDNDTVFVLSGTYYENVVVNRSIRLVGDETYPVVIDGNIFRIIADHVYLSGFTIQYSGTEPNFFAFIIKSKYNTIRGNTISYPQSEIMMYPLCGDNVVSGNTITSQRFFCDYSDNNNISGNTFVNNRIHILDSWNTLISGNTIIGASTGVQCEFSDDTVITRNIFSNIWEKGIILWTSHHVLVSENTVLDDCDVGIVVTSESQYNTIVHNTFHSGGIYIDFYQIDDLITHTIEDNTVSGRSILFYKNMNDCIVPSNAAQIILANCSFCTIQDLTLTDVYCGIQLGFSHHITVRGNTIQNNYYGVSLNTVSHSIIEYNIITDCLDSGLLLHRDTYHTMISNNNMSTNYYGIFLDSDCSNNSIVSNMIVNNEYGIYNRIFSSDTVNLMYHNNFIDNIHQAYDRFNGTCIWYNMTRNEGNYWSDFDEPSEGAYDNNSDGIVDSGYTIPCMNNQDHYPLMHRFVLGDMNVDGKVDFGDINPFVSAFTDPEVYQSVFQIKREIHGDINQDGVFYFSDINPFVFLLINGHYP